MATQKVDFDVLAHDKASDKLDRISRAFRKLKNDSDNVDGDGLTDLSKKLRKVADDFEKEGDRSGKGFGRGLKKWVTGGGKGLGGDFGTVFGSGFLGAVKTPILGPALVATIGGAVAVAAPAVGAIAGAGVVAGFGAGIAGLGLVFAAKSKAVQDKWAATMAQLGADMRLLAKPFEGTLIKMAGTFERTVDRFNPALAKAFQKSAGPIEKFADDAGRALEKLIPAIGPVTDALNGVLDATGPALQDAVGDLAEGLTDLARSVERNPDALADMVSGAGELSQQLLDLITTLNDANTAIEDLTGGTSGVEIAFEGLQLIVGTLTGPLALVAEGISKVSGLVNALRHPTDASGQSMAEAANHTVKLAQSLKATETAAKGIVSPLQGVADAASRQRSQFSAAIDAMGQWTSKAIAGSGAAISYQEALDNATASIKANGRNTDIGTEKGRANQRALLQVAEAANRQTAAMDAAGASNVATARTAEGSRSNFIRLARQMGFSATEAKRMADKMIQIPNVSRTAKLNANKKDLETKLAQAQRELKNPNLTKERRAELTANIRKLQSGVAAAKRALNSVPRSRTVTLITERVARNVSGASGGRVPDEPRALGGPVKRNSVYLVGEEGPETFVPNTDGFIVPNSRTTGAATPLGGGGTQKVQVELTIRGDGSRLGDALAETLRKYVRINGGNVQAVLGR
ncbi:hypothetical protein E1218_13095 [Kribbella turkmenica]|uniref:Tail tape measure protein n=1 Tax=Kribbella turkmenica TaxID=2530375 RepID=A0A4R4X823_9ACTN|nr:hypothetical protein [Kribbella turkmenica]TDD26545.1 hypothetical protein E1218_13095 [Kribbella turkmenica]